MIRFIIPILFLFILEGRAQTTSLHFDKPYYFAGEYIFFSFCNRELPDDKASVAIQLLQGEQIIDHQIAQINNRCGEGYLKLPYDLSSSVYQLALMIYQKGSLRQTMLAAFPITVFNDGDLPRLKTIGRDQARSMEIEPSNLEDIILLDDSIRFSLNIPEEFLEMARRTSVSIRDLELFSTRSAVRHQKAELAGARPLSTGVPFFGSRKVLNPTGVQNNLLFAFNGDDLQFDGAKVDLPTGSFKFQLDSFYGLKHIHLIDYRQSEIQVESVTKAASPTSDTNLIVDRGILNHLEINKEAKVINQVFRQLNQTVALEPLANKSKVTPDFNIDVQDYDIKGTVVNLFKEILTTLKFRQQRGRLVPKIFYERNGIVKAYSRSPLFVLNGRATYQSELVAALPLQEIAAIRIYSDYEVLKGLSPIAFGGVVEIDMVDQNYFVDEKYFLPSLPVQGLQHPIEYPITLQPSPEVPKIGSLLYWNPDQVIQGNQMDVSFCPGDVTSAFLVEVTLHLDTPEAWKTIYRVIKRDF